MPPKKRTKRTADSGAKSVRQPPPSLRRNKTSSAFGDGEETEGKDNEGAQVNSEPVVIVGIGDGGDWEADFTIDAVGPAQTDACMST